MTHDLDGPAAAPAKAASGGFAPLRHQVFLVLWVATVLGNTGVFVRDVASAWIVAELTNSPATVALVQAAGFLPIFFLAIPAGVLSDIVDRRKLLIAIQVFLAGVSFTLMLLAATGTITVTAIVTLTFLGGVGAALMSPTWQSIVPELVPRAELKNAVALNSLGFNIARAIGPALGGVMLAALGASVTYGTDVATYLVVIAALVWWRRNPDADTALAERFTGAFRAGLRYARASRDLHVVLLRAALFFAFASNIWALLPLVARNLLGGGAGFYGLLLGAVGAGAVVGAVLLPRLRQRFDSDALLLGAALIAAVVMAGLSFGPPRWLAVLLLLVLGGGWIAALTTLNGVAQAILPNWVRGRGLAIYLTVFNGAMAAGSLAWGAVAHWAGVPAALQIGGAGLVLVGLVAARIRLPAGEADLTPSNHWPEPLLAEPVENDRGPVKIVVEYRVPLAERPAFLAALYGFCEQRRRDGAYAWWVAEDAADPERIVEWFMVESWAEHLRQHRRVSKADATLQAELDRFRHDPGDGHGGAEHFLVLDPPRSAKGDPEGQSGK